MRSLCLCIVLAGCSSSGSSTKGQRGRASFAFRATPGCEDGCNLQQYSVAADAAHQVLSVSGASFAQVGSTTPGVATFTKTAEDSVEAVTAAAGDTDLQLLDSTGAEIDRVTVHVAAVAHLDFDKGWAGDGPILLENVPITVSPVTKRDVGQKLLLGAEGVHFSLSGTLSSLGPPKPTSPTAPATVVESLIVEGASGSGALHGQNGTQSFDVPITLVPLADLAKLVGEVKGTVLGSGGGTVDSVVEVSASTANGMVYGTSCSWSVSDSSVQVVVTDTTDQLQRSPVASITFKMSKAGSFTATCTIGRLTVMVPLKRDS